VASKLFTKLSIFCSLCCCVGISHATISATVTVDCTDTSTVISFDDISDLDTDDQRYNCRIDGQTMRLQLYKLGICTSEPTTSDFSSGLGTKCVMLYEDTTGQAITVSKGGSSTLSGIDLSGLTEGSYTHAVILIGDSVESQYSVSFPSGTTILGYSGSGNYCWTRTTSSYTKSPTNRNQLSTECGSSAGTSGFATKAFEYWSGANSKTHSNGNKSYLMKSTTEQATYTNSSTYDTITNLYGVVTFSATKTLTANTSAIDLGFELTNLGRAEFITPTAASCDTDDQPCLNALRPYDFDFCVEFDAKCQ
jgi:hypothetical protein